MRVGWALVFWILCASPVVTAAQELTEKQREILRQQEQHADLLLAQGRYYDAAIEYDAAFGFSKNPAFLIRAARSWHLAGRTFRAVTDCDRYLHVAPDGPDAAEAQLYVEKYRNEGIRQQAEEKTLSTELRSEREHGQELATYFSRHRARELHIFGIVFTATGVACLSVATYYIAESDRTKTLVFAGAGAALVGGGLVLYWLGTRAERSPQIVVMPPLGTSYGSIGLRATF